MNHALREVVSGGWWVVENEEIEHLIRKRKGEVSGGGGGSGGGGWGVGCVVGVGVGGRWWKTKRLNIIYAKAKASKPVNKSCTFSLPPT